MRQLLQQYSWPTFLLPLAVFLVVGGFEPTPERPGGQWLALAIPYAWYPAIYAAKIVATVAAMLVVAPGYRQFPLRIGLLAPLVGIAGAAVWIGLCTLDAEHRWLQPLLDQVGLGGLVGAGSRSAFNPLEGMSDHPWLAWSLLTLRFLGLVAVVPVIEEFFLRGFLMRFVVAADWWNVPIGKATPAAVAAAIIVPMLMHPGELLAAAAWFSLITWLVVRTRNLWDCVAAHAVTNLLLGVYVVASGDWRLL